MNGHQLGLKKRIYYMGPYYVEKDNLAHIIYSLGSSRHAISSKNYDQIIEHDIFPFFPYQGYITYLSAGVAGIIFYSVQLKKK